MEKFQWQWYQHQPFANDLLRKFAVHLEHLAAAARSEAASGGGSGSSSLVSPTASSLASLSSLAASGAPPPLAVVTLNNGKDAVVMDVRDRRVPAAGEDPRLIGKKQIIIGLTRCSALQLACSVALHSQLLHGGGERVVPAHRIWDSDWSVLRSGLQLIVPPVCSSSAAERPGRAPSDVV